MRGNVRRWFKIRKQMLILPTCTEIAPLLVKDRDVLGDFTGVNKPLKAFKPT